MRKKERSIYFKWGLTVFISGAALIMFFFFAESVGNILKVVPMMVDVCMPFIIGLVIAYLLCPIYNALVRRTRKKLMVKRDEEAAMKLAKPISLVGTIISFVAIISILLYLVIPELVDTIGELIVTLPSTFDSIIEWMQKKAEVYNILGPLEKVMENGNESFVTFLSDKMLPASESLVDGISAGIVGVFGATLDVIIGLFAMIYTISSKDMFLAQSRKLAYCIFNKYRAEKIMRGASIANRIFMKFVSANLMDGLIIGIATGIAGTIIGWDYVMLIAVIVGVTNLIPFFGPFIGGIPCGALLLTVDTMQCLYFVIFIVVLQQIDGCVIKPKIFGEGVGIPSFWVMFSIIVGGGLFGFIGMLLAVPVTACIIEYVNYRMNKKLKVRDLPSDYREYTDPAFYEPRETKFGKRVSKLLGRKYEEKKDETEDEKNS